MEDGWGTVNRTGVRRKTSLDPGAEPAIEKIDIFRPKRFEGPPCSRAGKDAFLLVDDDVHLVANPKRRHVAGKNIGWGQHVGQRAGAVGKLFDIEENCAGN